MSTVVLDASALLVLLRGEPGARQVEGGKLVIPASFRRAVRVKPGDTLIVELDQGELQVRSLPLAIQRVQARMRELNPEGRLLSEELIAARRAEAALD